jgi:hypothetical protein
MLSMLLNRKDADARSQDLTQATIAVMRDAERKQVAHIERLGSLENAHNIIRRQQQQLDVLNAHCHATMKVLMELVDWNDPEVRSKIRSMRSRHLDRELNEYLAEGIIINDPRRDPQWVSEYKYVP